MDSAEFLFTFEFRRCFFPALDLSTKTGEEADMQSSRRHIQRSTSLSDAKLKGMHQNRLLET